MNSMKLVLVLVYFCNPIDIKVVVKKCLILITLIPNNGGLHNHVKVSTLIIDYSLIKESRVVSESNGNNQ